MTRRRDTNTNPMNGIYWRKDTQKFLVQLNWNYKTYSLGYYTTQAEAKEARDQFDAARMQAANSPFSDEETRQLMEDTAQTLREQASGKNKHQRVQRRLTQNERLIDLEQAVKNLQHQVAELRNNND